MKKFGVIIVGIYLLGVAYAWFIIKNFGSGKGSGNPWLWPIDELKLRLPGKPGPIA